MENDEWISAEDFCASHHLELSFITSLKQFGLVEVTSIGESLYIPLSDLAQAERVARLYVELGINLEGIDAISYLLQRVEFMQEEIRQLRSQLRIYEHTG